ncbi:TetR/AcrR family transcriptional regulator [Novispirillum itersonii]|uniref:AcrR family transcriptional regulator n=1 Tax=Novispirillum itersonii TaxID=189 RepID=A0A7W9ZDN5_NOVIT|nr:TetR/AcrR family transcriptional regulator [Novispirillum itersonii]MBB6209440.1 AcrR family transcriptional regulator [Novispirillum itersonii]
MPARTAALKPRTARPSPKKDVLVEVAEGLFDRYGFHGTGIDRLVQDSGVARMTLYKHFPTKNALVRAVLERRDERFWAYINDGVAAREQDGPAWLTVFDVLGNWLEAEGSQGSLLLRALAEFSGHDVTVAGDAAFRCRASGAWFEGRLEAAGIDRPAERGWDLALLFEGAMAMTPVVGGQAAAGQARHAAAALAASW